MPTHLRLKSRIFKNSNGSNRLNPCDRHLRLCTIHYQFCKINSPMGEIFIKKSKYLIIHYFFCLKIQSIFLDFLLPPPVPAWPPSWCWARAVCRSAAAFAPPTASPARICASYSQQRPSALVRSCGLWSQIKYFCLSGSVSQILRRKSKMYFLPHL